MPANGRDHLSWLHRRPWTLAILATALLGLGLGFAGLHRAPAGPTLDELSIGHNAWHLSRDGRDEHGQTLPLYPKAFGWGAVGEYKNPVYIYALMPFEALLGPSTTVLRIPAVLFALLLALGVGLLVLELGRMEWIRLGTRPLRLLALAAALAALTTPWIHHFGRMALEAITFPSILVLALWLTLRCRRTAHLWTGLGAGLLWGLSLYTYSTARLLVPVLLLVLLLTHLGWVRRHPRAAGALALGALLAALPLAVFLSQQPDALTAKFYQRSVCQPPPRGLTSLGTCLERDAVQHAVWTRYRSYLGLSFLFRSGDPNLLHGAPGFGMLHLYWFPLLLLGLATLWRRRRTGLPWFLLVGWLLAPLAAALMVDHLHAIRAFAALPLLILVALLGAGELVRGMLAMERPTRRALAGVLGALLLLETGVYLLDYHTDYRRRLLRDQAYTAVVEAVRRGAAQRTSTGVLYLPPRLSWRDPASGRTRLTGHSSIIWRYYLRVPGPWYRDNAEAHRVRGGLPPTNAPRGSVAIQPTAPDPAPPCKTHLRGFTLTGRVDVPGYVPLPRFCIYRKP